MRPKLLLLPILLTGVFAARPAAADIAIGAEAGGILMAPKVGDGEVFSFGFAGRLGYAIDLEILTLIPELKVAYERPALDPTSNVLRPMAGVRASIGVSVFAVILFAHLGYGLPISAPDHIDGGLVYEAGAGVDFTSIPLFDIGIWGSYNSVRKTGPSYSWIGMGASVTLTI